MATDARILLTYSPAMRALYYGDGPLAELRSHGRVILHEREGELSAPELIAAAASAQIIVAHRATPVPAEVFAALPDLVAVVRGAVDTRNIAIPAASAAGVLVTHASAGFVPAVAELAIGMMIDLRRGISDYVAAYRAGNEPPQRMGRELAGSALGILGYGAIGRHLARLAMALGMTVRASDPFVTTTDPGIELVPMPELLAQSDIVVCLVVANDSTDNLMNARAFATMRHGSCFLNLSRGSLVDETALNAALDNGHLAGAALDVGRHGDQMPSPRLAARPNVIATPHIAGLTRGAADHQAFETARQVAAILRGEAPPGSMNADAATRLARLRS